MFTRIRWDAWIFLPALATSCWLGMMLVHECGNMLDALAPGGTITHLVFHPLAFPRTDIDPNPHPLIVAWSGPIGGAAIPAALAGAVRLLDRRSYWTELFAAFCLLANGAYL